MSNCEDFINQIALETIKGQNQLYKKQTNKQRKKSMQQIALFYDENEMKSPHQLWIRSWTSFTII